MPVAETPEALADRADIIFLNLFDSDAVASVLEGSDGIFSRECTGKIIIDTTTNHFGRVLSFYRMARVHGATYFECPVLGSVVPASQGNLTVLVSGDEGAYKKIQPLLGKIGSTIFYLGEPALATKMKLVNNLILGSFMATCAEAVALGEAAGIPREEVIRILLAGAGSSMVLNAKRENLITGDFSPHFTSALIYKDLHYLQDLCRTMNKPLFTGSAVKEMYAMALSKGIGHLDFSAVYAICREF